MLSFARRVGLGLLAVAALFLVTLDAAAAKRLALVLGNSHYQNAPVLENPANDAQDLARTLRTLGFEVIEQHDATRDAMAKAVRDFADQMPGTDMVLFFYAGHGLQMNGENYLLPVDVQISTPADVRFNTINLSDIRGEMEDSGHTSIIILDACRDNPFTDKLAQAGRSLGGRGLRPMEAAGQGSLVVYSTQPNNIALDGVGRNSPFTASLLKRMTTPGLEVRQMISRVRGDVLTATDNRQTPWDSSSLVGDVYLAAAPAGGTASPPASEPAVVAQAPSPPRQSPAPASTPVAEAETECERLAAFHMPVTTAEEVREAAATNWHHAADLCRAEVQAHPGDPRFIYALGRAQDQLKNYVEALHDFRTAANAGHVDALVELGRLYYFGHGVLQSYSQAFGFFNKAMEAGSARALANVAAMTGNGQGTTKDWVKSLDLAERAIEAGNPFGLEIVANGYFNGQGVPRDYKMASAAGTPALAIGLPLSRRRAASLALPSA